MSSGRVIPIREALLAEFPTLRDWGTQNCRRIAGSSTWSQHSWSNAHDAGHPADEPARGSETLHRAYLWLRTMRANGVTFEGVGIGTILYQNGSHTTLGHWDHIHYEASPKQRGTPPCAVTDPEDDEVKQVVEGIQRSLNGAGFLGANGKPLTVDGIWGTNTEHAHSQMTIHAQLGGGGAHTHEVEIGGPVPT